MTKLYGLDFHSYDIENNTGYGKIAHELTKRLDQKVDLIDKAGVVLNFCMPKDYKYKHYTVGYTPWESTQLCSGWEEKMQKLDDLWTTSTWCKEIFQKETGIQDIYVLPHGIEPEWTPIKRYYDGGIFTFLHQGASAARKGSDILLNIWWKHFRHNKDVRLVFKCTDAVTDRILDNKGSIVATPYDIENITVKSGNYSQAELWREFVLAHAMVYPSRNEGFGLIPFEALSTGLPTILPSDGGTGDFSKHGIELHNSTWVQSTAQEIHPGLWMNHSEDEIIYKMERLIECYESEAQAAYVNAHLIHSEYNWDNIVEDLISRIESRLH